MILTTSAKRTQADQVGNASKEQHFLSITEASITVSGKVPVVDVTLIKLIIRVAPTTH